MIQGGVPVFPGTRIPVEVVTAMLAAGWTAAEVREEFPTLTDEDVRAAAPR